MNPPTLLRKFIRFFWLKKDCFQLAINKTKHGNKKKVEDCAWTPVVDEKMLKFLESIEHKAGWYPFETGHAQVAYRAKALRTPDPYYDRNKFHLRTSIVKRKGVWRLLEVNHDLRKENVPQVWKKKLKFLFQSSYLQNAHTLQRHHS